MNAECLEIARRLVACKGWVWLPGMLRRNPRQPEAWQRIISVSDLSPAGNVLISAACVERSITGAMTLPMVCEWVESAGDCLHLPDLADPVTVAAVLVVVREEWDSAGAFAMPFRASDPGGPWSVLGGPRNGQASMDIIGSGPSELAALLAALEAAPQ